MKETVKKWEQGSNLGSLIPILTLDNLFPSPQDQEVIALIKAKTNKASKLTKRLGTNRQTPKRIQPLPVKDHKKDDDERKQKNKENNPKD